MGNEAPVASRPLVASHSELADEMRSEANDSKTNNPTLSPVSQAGMVCGVSVRGANAIIASRCCLLSGEFEDYWQKPDEHKSHFKVAHPTPSSASDGVAAQKKKPQTA